MDDQAGRRSGIKGLLMAGKERELVRWLTDRLGQRRRSVELGVGDDMAAVSAGGVVLITADMLLDGVHFETSKHSPEQIGVKAISCSLSDCAAMAVEPVAATVSIALPGKYKLDETKRLLNAMAERCEEYMCDLVGGDTTSWDHPLAVDVAMLARPVYGRCPVCRNGARPGDGLFVTGKLGGSLLGRHMSFTPRVAEAKRIADQLGSRLHAMMDISDGLAIDLDRIAEASGVSAELDQELLNLVVSEDALRAASLDGKSPVEHVLHDGEDFELLLAAEMDESTADDFELTRVGTVKEGNGIFLRGTDGEVSELAPKGYEHL